MIIHNKKVKTIRKEAKRKNKAKKASSQSSEEGSLSAQSTQKEEEEDFIAFDFDEPADIAPVPDKKRKREEDDREKKYLSLDILTSFPKPPWSDPAKPYSSDPTRM